ncbi:MAG: fumarylacetoacetate hydrolase family protein, partial [Pirellulaceae bacterium]
RSAEPFDDVLEPLAPIVSQEVWAAGVTWSRSRTARMEESQSAGGSDFYDKVYDAERPELFLKATPHRVVGTGRPMFLRSDSKWIVPEPELTVAVSSTGRIFGYTIGNDLSCRDIEGENPLYLPQAKVYNQCCGLGPWVTLASSFPPRDEVGIHISIRRDNQVIFSGATGLDQMARSLEDLIQWLGRDNDFPHGVFLLTGTGIVPENDFTLLPADVVDITIDGIGTLSNRVVQG